MTVRSHSIRSALTSISVAKTHAQYYQLDMELPKDAEGKAQEEDKVMVWYTLEAENGANNYFSDTASDAINNYYIYSRQILPIPEQGTARCWTQMVRQHP